jgi:EAL domain-containing protein (putative c-di-GMP-specific phosphodiesterase class I)/CheY-like chemotaxis protein
MVNPVDVMVIDDDCLQSHLLVEHCLALGRRVVRNYQCAADALRALRGARGITADTLLILDLNMPRMDGVEVLKELQLLKFPGRLLFVSGEESRMLEAAIRVARAMELYVVGALQKPVARESIRAAINVTPQVAQPPRVAPPRFSGDDLRAALRRGELEVFYQPQVVVATGALSGFEALMRWRHPELGVLGPQSFLEVLEAEGLLSAATRQLLRRVLEDAPARAAFGPRVPVAVNVAISDMERPDFCDEVISMLKLYKASPHDIHLEVTERGVSKDAIAALHSMSRLRLQRVKLAVDDFGTGEASLLRLREFPFDYIKIDRSFVRGACTDSANRAIYDACCAMAFQLGLGVVAEGVENDEDWRFISRRNCDQAQGYFIAHPMPLHDIPAWLEDWTQRQSALAELAA